MDTLKICLGFGKWKSDDSSALGMREHMGTGVCDMFMQGDRRSGVYTRVVEYLRLGLEEEGIMATQHVWECF